MLQPLQESICFKDSPLWKVIDLEFLEKFSFFYIENFRNLGYHEFLSLNILVFKKLLKVFYNNAYVNDKDENDTLRTYENAVTVYVMGRLYKITP